jgi:hypothetical protein
MMAYLHPFRLVESEGLALWHASIEQIYAHRWDYVAFHELVSGIDVGPEPPYYLVVRRDGALGLPPLDNLRSTKATVEFFHRRLVRLLLGGITSDNLDLGSIIDWQHPQSARRPGCPQPVPRACPA